MGGANAARSKQMVVILAQRIHRIHDLGRGVGYNPNLAQIYANFSQLLGKVITIAVLGPP